MQKSYKPSIPQNIGDLMDLLGWMMLNSPKFEDDTGYFPGQNIETEFFALNEGLKVVRDKVGEENYQALVVLSARMRGHFEADPENRTDDTIRGRDCIVAMEDVLKASKRHGAR